MRKSVVTVQRAFLARYAKDRLTDKTIRAWYKQFTETECLLKQKAPTLTRVWQELEYHTDVCRVTRSAHIEHLYLSKRNLFSFPVAVNNSIKVGPSVFLL